MSYDWYFKALETAGDCGELTRNQIASLGVSEGDAQPGFYRKRKFKNGPFIPVAIWQDDTGHMLCVCGGDMVDAGEIWTFACRNPISEATYRMIEAGGSWPDQPPTIGHNSGDVPTDPFEALKLEFEQEREQAQEFLKSKIETKDRADMAASWSKKLAAIAKKATDLHKVEKQPHLDASRAVDDKWRDLKEDPKSLSTDIKRAMDDFLREEDRKERQRRAEELAEKQAQLQKAIAEAQAEGSGSQPEEVQSLIKQVEQVAKTPINAQAGRTGSKVSLRTFVSARIVDYDKALKALSNHPEMKSLVEQLANRAVRAGIDLDGVERHEEKRAA